MNTPGWARASKAGLMLAGGLALLLGAALLLRTGLTLPTRHPPVAFHFSGLSRVLLAAGPGLVGVVLLALGRGRLAREAAATRWLVGAAIAAVALAFVLAPRH